MEKKLRKKADEYGCQTRSIIKLKSELAFLFTMTKFYKFNNELFYLVDFTHHSKYFSENRSFAQSIVLFPNG